MTLQEMKRRRQEKGYTYAQLAEKSGIPVGTLQKIFNGETASPRYSTIQALEEALGDEPLVVCEPVAGYGVSGKEKQPGEYTIEDYRALPEERRVELIDGVFYDMAAPTTFHQLLAGEIYRQISNYILDRKGKCTPFISPVDVQLDNDERTMVQPDVIIVCSRDQIVRQNVMGAPDFVLEVVSPSSKRRDYLLKLHKYQNAGVREYWLVDPGQKLVLVYFFESEVCPAIYPLEGRIPVNLFGGDLELELDRMAAWLAEEEALEEREAKE